MSLRDLAIWNRKNNQLDNGDIKDSFQPFYSEIDRLFDGFFGDFGRTPSTFLSRDRVGSFSPKIDISNDASAIEIVAELPGLDKKDVQVSLKDNILTIKGEKKSSDEKKEKNYYRVERSFGSFERSIRVPEEVSVDKIKASFKNGVLSVTLPKSEIAKEQARKIEVKAA